MAEASNQLDWAPSDGALRREIGVLGIAAVTTNIIMGSGLFVIPAAMGVLGGWAPVVIALCALVMAAVTLCFAEASSRVPTAGGVYGFVREALGPIAGAVVGGMVWMSGGLAAAGILAAAIDQLTPFAPWISVPLIRTLVIIALCVLFAWIPTRGAKRAARASEITIAIKILPLVVFVALIAGLPAAPNVAPRAIDLGTAAPLFILGIYLCAGMESGTVMNGEVRNPTRTVPAGLFLSLIVFSALAIAIQLAAGHALGDGLSSSRAPLVEAAARVGAWFPPLMAAAAITSMLGCASGLATAIPRAIYALARDGSLPHQLARLDTETRTPTAAIILHAILVAALASSGEFGPLAIAASLASMAVYVIGCVAAIVLRRRGIEQAGTVVEWRATPAAAVVAIAANLCIILAAKGAEIGALLASMVIFALLAIFGRRTRVSETERV